MALLPVTAKLGVLLGAGAALENGLDIPELKGNGLPDIFARFYFSKDPYKI